MAERKRELIDTGNDKRFVRRDSEGKFKDVVDVGASLAADQRQHSQHQGQVRPGRPRRPLSVRHPGASRDLVGDRGRWSRLAGVP